MHRGAHQTPVVEPFRLVPTDTHAPVGGVPPHGLDVRIVVCALRGDPMDRASRLGEVVHKADALDVPVLLLTVGKSEITAHVLRLVFEPDLEISIRGAIVICVRIAVRRRAQISAGLALTGLIVVALACGHVHDAQGLTVFDGRHGVLRKADDNGARGLLRILRIAGALDGDGIATVGQRLGGIHADVGIASIGDGHAIMAFLVGLQHIANTVDDHIAIDTVGMEVRLDGSIIVLLELDPSNTNTPLRNCPSGSLAPSSAETLMEDAMDAASNEATA